MSVNNLLRCISISLRRGPVSSRAVPPVSLSSVTRGYSSNATGTDIKERLSPEYKPRVGEEVEVKRARLLYQSRKRGMLENGLLLSSFAERYLRLFNSEQLDQYDHLINTPSNDWQLYYWFTGREETPSDYNNEVMDLIKQHTQSGNLSADSSSPHL